MKVKVENLSRLQFTLALAMIDPQCEGLEFKVFRGALCGFMDDLKDDNGNLIPPDRGASVACVISNGIMKDMKAYQQLHMDGSSVVMSDFYSFLGTRITNVMNQQKLSAVFDEILNVYTVYRGNGSVGEVSYGETLEIAVGNFLLRSHYKDEVEFTDEVYAFTESMNR